MVHLIARLATLALIVASTLCWMKPGQAAAAEPTGTWLTEDGRARVRTELCGPQNANLCGYVVWGQKPLDDTGNPRTDKANPDPQKQARLVLGHQLILGLKPNAERHYEGKIYNADNGKSYDVTVWSDGPDDLTVKGCMLVLFCGSQSWKRVSDLAPGQLQGATDAPGGPRADREWAAKASASGSARARPASAPAPK